MDKIEQETIESDYGQMAGKKDISRVTVQVGRFAVHDAFDGNSYSSDPRAHFLNGFFSFLRIRITGCGCFPAEKVFTTLQHP